MARLRAICLRHVVQAAVVAVGLGVGPCHANDSFASEYSHALAGMAIAAGATVAADYFGAGENRGWIGFGTSVGISFVEEAAQVIANGSSQVSGSALDFASNLVGAAFGAWVTDKYILSPVVTKDAHGRQRVGVALKMSF